MTFPTLIELEHLARQAGEILRAGYSKDHKVIYKGVIDPVTEVDHASEDLLLAEINKRWPGSYILSEETGITPGDREHSWYVDPLDGTVNYAHGIPFFSVSIAYAYQGVMRLGTVYDPMRDEMFSAERGQGARLNDKPIRASDVSELQKSSACYRLSVRCMGYGAGQLRELCAFREADAGRAALWVRSARRVLRWGRSVRCVLGALAEAMGYRGGRADRRRGRSISYQCEEFAGLSLLSAVGGGSGSGNPW